MSDRFTDEEIPDCQRYEFDTVWADGGTTACVERCTNCWTEERPFEEDVKLFDTGAGDSRAPERRRYRERGKTDENGAAERVYRAARPDGKDDTPYNDSRRPIDERIEEQEPKQQRANRESIQNRAIDEPSNQLAPKLPTGA